MKPCTYGKEKAGAHCNLRESLDVHCKLGSKPICHKRKLGSTRYMLPASQSRFIRLQHLSLHLVLLTEVLGLAIHCSNVWEAVSA